MPNRPDFLNQWFDASEHPFTIEYGLLYETISARPEIVAQGCTRLGLFVLPPFQRGAVWTVEQQRRWIESIFWGLPLPPYVVNRDDRYLAPDSRDGWLLDGQQRWRAIYDFVADRFEVGGQRWSDLGDRDQRRFEMRPFVMLRCDLPSVEACREVYLRLAYGGTPHEPVATEAPEGASGPGF